MRYKSDLQLIILTIASLLIFGYCRPLRSMVNVIDTTPYPIRPENIPLGVTPLPEQETPLATNTVPSVVNEGLTETAIFSMSETSIALTQNANWINTPFLPVYTPTKKNNDPGPTQVPPTQVLPTQVLPTQVLPTQVPPTQVLPTQAPPTQVPPAPINKLALRVKDSNHSCKNNEAKVRISLSATGGNTPYRFAPSKNFFFTYPAHQSAEVYVEVRSSDGQVDAKLVKFSPCI